MSWLREALGELLGELFEWVTGCLLILFLLVWWIGGPGMTALLWSGGDKRIAVGFLAAWTIVTALYFTASRLIRRARRG